MSLEVLYYGITGIVGPSNNAVLPLLTGPTTGVDGRYDVAVDPIDGPAQRYNIDFGVTHLNPAGTTAVVVLNMAGSDIKEVMNNYRAHGVTGPLTLRVLYNY
jgi:hypothetical protein